MKTKTIKKCGTVQKIFKWEAVDVFNKMKQVAKNEKLELVFLKAGDGIGGYNYGACAGKTVMLAPFIKVKDGERVGKFEFTHGCSNPIECQFITFFHELAHAKLTKKVPSIIQHYSWNDTSKFQFELWLTMLGVEYAHKKYGIKFSDNAVEWLMEEAKSYIKKEESEVGYGLRLMNSDDFGYEVKSEWEFRGRK